MKNKKYTTISAHNTASPYMWPFTFKSLTCLSQTPRTVRGGRAAGADHVELGTAPALRSTPEHAAGSAGPAGKALGSSPSPQ